MDDLNPLSEEHSCDTLSDHHGSFFKVIDDVEIDLTFYPEFIEVLGEGYREINQDETIFDPFGDNGMRVVDLYYYHGKNSGHKCKALLVNGKIEAVMRYLPVFDGVVAVKLLYSKKGIRGKSYSAFLIKSLKAKIMLYQNRKANHPEWFAVNKKWFHHEMGSDEFLRTYYYSREK